MKKLQKKAYKILINKKKFKHLVFINVQLCYSILNDKEITVTAC